MNTKDIVVGIGEIGLPILKHISKATIAVGYDINSKLMNKRKFLETQNIPTRFLHICIPYHKNFISTNLQLVKKFQPQGIIIHSTIRPHTTKILQKKLSIPVIYSATRGVHKRMFNDLKRYTKFFAVEKKAPKSKWASSTFTQLMKKCRIRTKQMTNPLTLELAKIVVDTSYYGWLINYSQLSNIISQRNKVDYEEMWSFSEEIHKFLGNRPKMFPGYIGGHCVIPNLELINDKNLDLIDDINQIYLKNIKNAKSIAKKYLKK